MWLRGGSMHEGACAVCKAALAVLYEPLRAAIRRDVEGYGAVGGVELIESYHAAAVGTEGNGEVIYKVVSHGAVRCETNGYALFYFT